MILPVVAAEAVRIQHLPEALPEAVAENSRRGVRIQNTGAILIVKKEKQFPKCLGIGFSFLMMQLSFHIHKIFPELIIKTRLSPVESLAVIRFQKFHLL